MTNECSLQAQARWPTSSVPMEIFPKLHLHSHLLPGICSLAKYRNSITLLPEARSHPKLPGEQPLPTRCQMVFKGVQTGGGEMVQLERHLLCKCGSEFGSSAHVKVKYVGMHLQPQDWRSRGSPTSHPSRGSKLQVQRKSPSLTLTHAGMGQHSSTHMCMPITHTYHTFE